MNTILPVASTARSTHTRARLGFAVTVGVDGNIPEDILIGLREAGYDGIEPNCLQVQHLESVIEACQRVGLSIHAIPTGRWMNVAEARADYARYTRRALEVLSEGAPIAASLGAPLIFGLIRGPSSVADAEAEEFLTLVILELLQRTPDLKILVEPIAPGEAGWPHTIGEGEGLIKRLNALPVKLLADSYYIARSGEDLHSERGHGPIGHLHIRDQQKQIPSGSSAEYPPILHLWREQSLILSFEPNIDLGQTLESAIAGLHWIRCELDHRTGFQDQQGED